MASEDPKRGALLAVSAAALAAVFLLAYQAANRAAPREVVVLAMLACATVFNGGFALTRWRVDRSHVSRKVTAITILAFAAFTIGGNVGVAGALQHLGPGITGTILQVQIFMVAIGERVFLGERIRGSFVVGALLAFGGFVVLGLPSAGEASIDGVGVGFAMLGAASFAGMLVWTRGAIRRIEPVTVNVARLALAVVVLGAFPGQLTGVLALPANVWLFVLAAAALGPFTSRLCLMFAAKHLSASRTKLITLVSPVMAFGLQWLVLGEPPSLRELGGGALILCGVLVPTVLRAREEARR